MKHVYVIAEAGVNHNGNFDNAIKMVDAAKEAGADYIKFQTFIPEKLVSVYAKKAKYQSKNTNKNENQIQMLNKLALSYDQFINIKYYCDEVGIGFLSTAFDNQSIEFLDGLDMDFWKIPSGEITNLPYLEAIARTKKEVVLSTGMSSLDEIKCAIDILEKNGSGRITLMHCNTQYPTPYEDVNLLAMKTMERETGKECGYSDHTLGIEIPIAAVAMGAPIIEKHFTLGRAMKGPDHKASLEIDELKRMILAIRNIEYAIGDGDKRVTSSENENIIVARKSIVAARDISKGEIFSEENITTKRPGNGISPMRWYEVLGNKAGKDYKKDELIGL